LEDEKCYLKLNKAESCIKMKNGEIAQIKNIAGSKISDDTILITGRKCNKLTNFFDDPSSLHLLNTESTSNLSHLLSWKLSEIKEKMK